MTLGFRLSIIKFLLTACLFLTVATALAREPDISKAAVLISQNIKPYMEAVEGLSRSVSKNTGTELEVFSLSSHPCEKEQKEQKILKKELVEGNFSLFIAVGPEASRFIWTEFYDQNTPMLFTIVLNPEKVVGQAEQSCGISLNIPVKMQIREIARTLPDSKRIGLMYDAEYNDLFFKEASEYALELGLKIVPLQVSSKKEIPLALKKNWNNIDSLWLIPDRTVISESIIHYIIKQALLKKMPVIGYNLFFYESGAALAFVFDYEELGYQTGRLALRVLSGDTCQNNAPKFKTLLNQRVMKRLGIKQDNGGQNEN
ncbi:MAG: hypothetical protein GY795_41700 [Desulfobacterales bacterium]|nr:hypothetical protein [Desulfobacterales bacterium]